MMTKLEPFEKAVIAYFKGDDEVAFTIHYPNKMTRKVYVKDCFETQSISSLELVALEYCFGRVLDAGAGLGRHSIILQKRNYEVFAIDTCRIAVETMKKRGIVEVSCTDFFSLNSANYNTIIMLNRGLGICGTLSELPRVFSQCRRLIKPGGQVLADSNPTYSGKHKMRIDFLGERGPEFDWLYIDYNTLRSTAIAYGWECECLAEKGDDHLCRFTLKNRYYGSM